MQAVELIRKKRDGNILSADEDIIRLLDRSDLFPVERQRLYSMLAAFATKPCVDALLLRAAGGDRDAVSALGRAEAGALEFLLPQLPTQESATELQVAAYNAAAATAAVKAAPAARAAALRGAAPRRRR